MEGGPHQRVALAHTPANHSFTWSEQMVSSLKPISSTVPGPPASLSSSRELGPNPQSRIRYSLEGQTVIDGRRDVFTAPIPTPHCPTPCTRGLLC